MTCCVVADRDALKRVMRRRGLAAGPRIAAMRHAKGWGPTVFAGLIGVPLQTLHKIEKSEIVPRDNLKAAICLALDIELAELYPWPTSSELMKEVAAIEKFANGQDPFA